MTLISLPNDGQKNVFVFGSNLRGLHAGGAAAFARKHYGAEDGASLGYTGECFAIPTMDRNFTPLPLEVIRGHVRTFLCEAAGNPSSVFYLTPIACGIAGYRPDEIAPLFANTPANVILPAEFTAILSAEAPRT